MFDGGFSHVLFHGVCNILLFRQDEFAVLLKASFMDYNVHFGRVLSF